MVHAIALTVALAGVIVAVFGALRIIRAPSLAVRRATAAMQAPHETERYARGLTDFYRISGAVAVLIGIVLLLVPIFAL